MLLRKNFYQERPPRTPQKTKFCDVKISSICQPRLVDELRNSKNFAVEAVEDRIKGVWQKS